MISELQLQAEIRLSLGARKDCVFWRNAVGTGTNQSGNMVKYGLGKGSADLIGMVRPSGRTVALEIKLPGGRVSNDQQMFLALINSGGGFGRVVRSVDEANRAVDQAIDSANAWIGRTFS